MQRVSKVEYNEWKENFVTQQLFNFFKLEAELHRHSCLTLQNNKSFNELGEEYFKRQFAAQCYDMLGTIEYEDLFPVEDTLNEDNQRS